MIKTEQFKYKENEWVSNGDNTAKKAQLILLFGSRPALEEHGREAIKNIKEKFPEATVVSVSSAGNIIGQEFDKDGLTATAIEFEKTKLKINVFEISTNDPSDLGNSIAIGYDKTDLKSLLVFSTKDINAGELVDGINQGFNNEIPVSGGVAGDDLRFEKTYVGLDDELYENAIITIGFYSEHLLVSHGSKGGWNPFGPPRKVTKAEKNVLYEIDNQPVLDLYKEYLGATAEALPGAGLLFPFAIINEETGGFIVRGIQGVDEKTSSITLYGNVEVGQTLRLMKANHSVLIEGAGESALDTMSGMEPNKPELSILVSCVARYLALDQLVEEELEEVQHNLGESCTMCGFYSYSEFSPLKGVAGCFLHNQTMTITAFSESE